ncbi:LOW QUALITY PROTEIN: SH2 domain-containing protein 7-like [Xiphias gladius]|uniref:LOW QUALITY PROTEIN: SH2 domain-containing protein 7-like n=1 Tax=Xiphias gladius TaxID=8245 RepID=UPI001A98A3B4|nr:LOW QUALITY PROTEIN: SH2 domain-containing protein 7-like [Xiphias gladius]
MSSVYISHVGSYSLRAPLVGDKRLMEVERSISMFAEMTPGSNHALLISRKGSERTRCAPYGQQKPGSEKIFSGSRTKDQTHPKSPSFRNCLKFFFKDQARMDQREPRSDSHAELTEGRLRELASKWFIETQVPLIIHNGFFPTWFLGFITRKDAEEILREKELGCFLVRLSDKAIGYILSYKGRDRCRHFVINQSEKGQFVVCGDSEGHNTVPDLIEYYKKSPIEPFGEYLTSSCFEVMNEELYDTIQINPKEKPLSTHRAVKNVQKQQTNLALEQPPTRPPKNNRTLEEVPPLPHRNRHLDGCHLNDQDRILYAQLMKQSPKELPRFQHIFQGHLPGDNPGRAERSTAQDQNVIRCSPESGQPYIYSELSLLENSKSRSLSLLENGLEGEHYYRPSARPQTPLRLSPKPIRQATGWIPRSEKTDSRSAPSSLDRMNDSAVYHLAGKSGSPRVASSETSSLTFEQHSDSVYTEVPNERFSPYNTYELIPGHEDAADLKTNSNTYEPLEDFRPKALKNDKWKWLFPEVKRKW